MRRKWVLVSLYGFIGFATRILADALHLPGYMDSLGSLISASIGGPLAGGLSGLLTGLLLYKYYQIYLLGWIGAALAGVTYGYLKRKGFPVVGIGLASLSYVAGWVIVYCLATHTWSRSLMYFETNGAMILALDTLFCGLIAELLSKKLGKNISLKSVGLVICIALIVGGVSWFSVRTNEWGITNGFPEREGYLKFHTKMDIVWIWIGGKGINNFYYPNDRFTRGSPGYQVWIGLYWIQGKRDIEDVSLVSMYAVWDQNFWNSIHGVRKPYTYVNLVRNISKINFKGLDAYLMYGGMVTQSDVEPYEQVQLEGFFITFYDEENDRTGIVYACSLSGEFEHMVGELWDVVNSWNLKP